MGAGHDPPRRDDDGPHRDLVLFLGLPCLVEREPHPAVVRAAPRNRRIVVESVHGRTL
jgi:hypothetical protein